MPVDLEIRSVLAETWSLYRRLFVRSVALGLAIFVLVELVQVLAHRTLAPATAGLITLSLTLAGTSILQGALVEVVRDLHEGAEPGNAFEHYERATTRFGALVGVSLLAGLGIGLGIVALVVPGLVLATRWALIVPVVMLEGVSPRAALRRSGELVSGHGRAVFVVLLNVFLRVGFVGFLFALLASAAGGSFLVTWLVGALGSALTTPYAAHAMTVVYYRIVDPTRPLVAEPTRWSSVWDEQDRAA
jgi:hypothetical protein